MWNWQNPVVPASGTFGFGYEFAEWYDINCLGAISLKGTTRRHASATRCPALPSGSAGMINAVGLQNPGIDAVISREIPALPRVYSPTNYRQSKRLLGG